MIFAPPGSAKTTYVSRLSIPWIMQRKPGWSIIGASHKVDFALENSSYAIRYIQEYEQFLDLQLKTENTGRWRTTEKVIKQPDGTDKTYQGCDYLAAGVDSGIAGFRADLAIIDDPVPKRDEADRENFRNKVWRWFHGDLARRLKPEGRLVLMHTRWHEDDLAGRLLKYQPGRWKVICLPAIATGLDDPLGRAPGDLLWDDDDYGYGASLRAIQKELETSGAALEWASLYQQDPKPAEGSIFKVQNLIDRIIPPSEIPVGVQWGRGWDFAATKDQGTLNQAYSAGAKIGKTMDGKYIIGHMIRQRWAPEELTRNLENTAKLDGHGVRISIPQDPGQAGKFQVEVFVKMLSGFTVDSSPETGDKATRAGPFASQVNVGNVMMVAGDWNAPFIEEARAFPVGVTMDQIDACSRAFGIVYDGGTSLWSRIGAMAR